MVFAQLTYRESLRYIESCLKAFGSKLYHCGIKSKVTKSTLAYWNEKQNGIFIVDRLCILIRYAVLITIIKKELNSKFSINRIIQILSVRIFEKTELNQTFTKIEAPDKITNTLKELILFD